MEKALKGIYAQALDKLPPKTHNLVLLVEKIKLDLPEELYDSIFKLNGVSVPTRYPEDIGRLKKEFSRQKTEMLFQSSRELLKWLKRKLER
jgi:HEPN domain-containing protein